MWWFQTLAATNYKFVIEMLIITVGSSRVVAFTAICPYSSGYMVTASDWGDIDSPDGTAESF